MVVGKDHRDAGIRMKVCTGESDMRRCTLLKGYGEVVMYVMLEFVLITFGRASL